MKKKRSLLAILINSIIIVACFKSDYLLCDQNDLIKTKNIDAITIGVNETATIKHIWKEKSLKNWSIKIKVLEIEETGVKVTIRSPTFFGEGYDETIFIKMGKHISIIQSEEVETNIKLEKILIDKAVFSLNIIVAPPAPELSQQFDVEIK